jgi:hypothetical protein
MSFDATEWSLCPYLYVSRGLGRISSLPRFHDVGAAQQDKAPKVEFSRARFSQIAWST